MMNMIFIYFIIVIISINDIITTPILKNASTNRIIIIASCQATKNAFESISLQSARHYYFYFTSQSSSSSALSSSSSFLSLLDLSYCEHQQTTYYSSNDKKHSLPFHYQNAVISAIDQLSSTTSNTITLMSSSSSSLSSSSASVANKSLIDIDHDNNIISTTINSLTTSSFSNMSLSHTSLPTTQQEYSTLNIMMIIGCIIAGILMMIIIYIIFKHCCNRDKGSYKIDESKNFTIKSHLDNHNTSGCTGKILLSNHHHRQNLITTNEENIIDSKEWYV
ncbi:unnamed protein product [Rotaria sordida]|uniref:Mid2 domain-containing protein n=2 Tax=Rotaria sordida TaxID=392033 RepID=A0A819A9T5_9BILA|nr:unnamed protein product [Rotaria sordida]CAF3780247.1 unnamed protein product [Rotaria sordida]